MPKDVPDEPDDAFEDANCDGVDGDREAAIFVAGSGAIGADTNDGTLERPVKTIGRGIELAQSMGKKAVYLCSGVYNEALSILGASGPVSLYGGYNCLAENEPWRRNDDNVIVKPSSGVPLVIADSTEPLVVDRLSFQAPDATQGAPSSYAVQVRNASARIRHAEIEAGRAAAGDNGLPGSNGGVLLCGGLFDCGNGSNGPNGSPGASGLGYFGLLGYLPTKGQAGFSGTSGGNGIVAAVPPATTIQHGKCSESNNCTLSNDVAQGQQGRCGCGGGRGTGGTGAWGGGASIGLYVYGVSASVRLEASTVRSREGGRGGLGGPGGSGVSGTNGTQGAADPYKRFSCEEQCPAANPDCGVLNCAVEGGGTAAGTIGGPGGRGGYGGLGGSGAGGPSFAIATAGGAKVDATGSTLEPGSGGPGGTGAPNGASGKQQAF